MSRKYPFLIFKINIMLFKNIIYNFIVKEITINE
jgi:hypothetical protein